MSELDKFVLYTLIGCVFFDWVHIHRLGKYVGKVLDDHDARLKELEK